MEYRNIKIESGKELQFPIMTEEDSDKITLDIFDLFIQLEEEDDPNVSYKLVRELTKKFLPRKEAVKWNKLTMTEFQEALELAFSDGEAGKE